MTQDTITEMRTETTTREITKHRCPLCETYHESDDLAVMKAGGHETDLCRYCAASILDVDSEEIDVYGGETDTTTTTTTTTDRNWVGPLTTMITTAIVGTIGVLIASNVMADIPTSEFADVSQVGAPAFTPLDILPLLLPVMVAWAMLRVVTIGPRP